MVKLAWRLPTNAKIVSEYDQEIPQSQTADNPMAPRGRATALERTAAKPRGGGGLKAFHWHQILALGSAAVEVHEMFSSLSSYLIQVQCYISALPFVQNKDYQYSASHLDRVNCFSISQQEVFPITK